MRSRGWLIAGEGGEQEGEEQEEVRNRIRQGAEEVVGDWFAIENEQHVGKSKGME